MNAPIDRRTTPRSVLLAAVAWALLGGLLIVSWLTLDPGRGVAADESSVERITGTLGDSAVSDRGGSSVEILLLLLGIAVLILTAALLARSGWALWPLALVGIGGVIVLALGGRWQTLVAMVLVLVGTAALMTGGARRFLAA